MFLGKKNQYCENEYTTKHNLQIQYVIPIKLSMAFFHRTRTKNYKIHVETQMTPNNQSRLEKE